MKILLSAYACEPGRGSEPGVGWNWALELARLGHDVWVLTRGHKAHILDAALEALPERERIHPVYYLLPRWAAWWKKGRRGIHLHYLLWQACAYRVAKDLHRRERFDLVHHVTFASVRQPSFMGELGIPFIFGPVGGGDTAPWRLRRGFGPRAQALALARDAANVLTWADPLMRRTYARAERIFVTSEQTRRLLPACCRDKSRVSLAIGCEFEPGVPKERRKDLPFRFLYVGRFVDLKGMKMGIDAFARILAHYPASTLTLVGEGPDGGQWLRRARRLGVENKLTWLPWMNREQLSSVYKEHDALLFPSLYDAGGMVVLEAMAEGLPVVCLDLGGPGRIVTDECGIVVNPVGKGCRETARALSDAMERLAGDERLYARLSRGALKRGTDFTWEKLARSIYERGDG